MVLRELSRTLKHLGKHVPLSAAAAAGRPPEPVAPRPMLRGGAPWHSKVRNFLSFSVELAGVIVVALPATPQERHDRDRPGRARQ
ncbi:protein of unknown function [Cupriavidus taiwanensis]|nr:protein of unknown function [Cupriavidus taiwanensis]